MYEDTPYDRRPSFFAKFFLRCKKPNGFAIAFIILFCVETAGGAFCALTDGRGLMLFAEFHLLLSACLVGVFVMSGYIVYRTFDWLREMNISEA